MGAMCKGQQHADPGRHDRAAVLPALRQGGWVCCGSVERAMSRGEVLTDETTA